MTHKTTSGTCSLIWSYVVVMLIFGTPSLHSLCPLNCCTHIGSTAGNSSTTRPACLPWRHSHRHLMSGAEWDLMAIKSHSTPLSRRPSAANADHRRCPPTPPQRQPSRDSSRSTWGKPRSFPSSFKKWGGMDLKTSIDLFPTDPAPSPATVLPLLDFPVPALNKSPVGARLKLYCCNWQRISADPWVIPVLHDSYIIFPSQRIHNHFLWTCLYYLIAALTPSSRN